MFLPFAILLILPTLATALFVFTLINCLRAKRKRKLSPESVTPERMRALLLATLLYFLLAAALLIPALILIIQLTMLNLGMIGM